MKKIIPFILTIIMLITMTLSVTSCDSTTTTGMSTTSGSGTTKQSQTSGTTTAPTTPAEAIKLKGWGAYTFDDTSGITSYKQQMFWQSAEEALNLDIEWDISSTADNAHITQFGLIMSSGDLPDFFANYNRLLQIEEYGRLGAILAVNDLLENNNMPNFAKKLQEYPEVKGSVTSADGKIYIIPRIMAEVETRAWPGFSIRGDWLEQLDLDSPETTDQLYDTLKKIQDSIESVQYAFTGDYKPLLYAFGVAVRAGGNAAETDIFVEDGEIKYAGWDDRYKEGLIYLNKLASEKLINPTPDQINDMVGGISAMTWGSWAGVLGRLNTVFDSNGQGKPMVALDYFTGPQGYKGNSSVHRAIDANWGACISSTTEYPEAVASIFEYIYSEEGSQILFYGIEGDTYEIVSGAPKFTSKVSESQLGVVNFINNYIGNYSCLSSHYKKEAYQSTLSEEGLRGNIMVTETAMNDPSIVPMMRYSADEITRINEICLDLNTYFDENRDAFVFGNKSFDEWESYVAGFETLKVNELLEIMNAAYQRFIDATT